MAFAGSLHLALFLRVENTANIPVAHLLVNTVIANPSTGGGNRKKLLFAHRSAGMLNLYRDLSVRLLANDVNLLGSTVMVTTAMLPDKFFLQLWLSDRMPQQGQWEQQNEHAYLSMEPHLSWS
jgi:hypothetical protein